MLFIPEEDAIHIQLKQIAQEAKVVVFIGLPGTGKSLFINHFHHLANSLQKEVQTIQWDVARKAFETEKINSIFPMEEGQVHPGVRLSAGSWLLNYFKKWAQSHMEDSNKILLIEAPLVGNRFSELIHPQDDLELEKILSDPLVHFLLPVPSLSVRAKIEADRTAQVSETARTWSGAKPSVMKILWQDTFQIAKNLAITAKQDSTYDPQVYADTYSHLARHRQLTVLDIAKIYPVKIENESSLHRLKNSIPSPDEVDALVQNIKTLYPSQILMEAATSNWYKS